MALPCMCTSVCNCDEEGAFTPPRAADGVKEQVMSRVLVVDDDPQILRMLQMWLEREGHEVFLAEDGHDALNIVDWAPDCIDLMITDIVMPEKEGLELIMELKRKVRPLPIIAISGGGDLSSYSYLKMARMLKADRAFRKPLDMQELLTAVSELTG